MKLARCLPLLVALAALWSEPGVLAAGEPAAILADGQKFQGKLTTATATWQLGFEVDGATRRIAAGDLVAWGAPIEPGRDSLVVLAGGGLIVGIQLRIDQENLWGVSSVFGSFSIPLELVSGIIFRPPLDRTLGDQLLARVQAAQGQADRLLLDNGDELSGNITALEPNLLRVETDAGKIEVEPARLSVVTFNPALLKSVPSRGQRAIVGFRDGSRVSAVRLVATGGAAEVEISGGKKLAAATDTIVFLQPLGGRIDYLSDLKPSSYRHVPFLQLSWPFQADRSVAGSQLRVAGRLYPKGLGMHSPSRITYDLSRPYKSFQAEVAIDHETLGRGSAVFRVFTDDGSGSWQEQATSMVVRGGDAPVAISADLTGAKRVSLLVDYADRGDEQDHADWLNARLVR